MSLSEPIFGSFITNMKVPDSDIGHLMAENRSLQVELTQCQADKDFVWSLWKRLQVSNPDVTEAISLVIQREKEKSENKDRKVLEIIQVKDDRIEELQNLVAKQAQEVNDVLSKKVESTEKSSRLLSENERLQDRVTRLECQLRSEENKEKSLEDNFRKTVEGTEREKYDLSRKLSKLMTDCEMAKTERDHAVNRQTLLEERTRNLEQEVSQKMLKFEELVREVEDSTTRLSRYESQTSQQRRDLDFKNQELENVRKELKELWLAHNQLTEHSGQQADLIRQLQSLQQDTHKMMKNQEDAFTMESTSLQQLFTDVNAKYESSKRTESDLRQQVLELKKSLMDKDDLISSLQSQSPSSPTPSQQPQYSTSLLDIVQEVDSLPLPNTSRRGRSLTRLPHSPSKPIPSPTTRSRSMSPLHHPIPSSSSNGTNNNISPQHLLGEKRETSESRHLDEMETSLHFKTRQIEELRRAHDNRRQRMTNLQSSYRLAREEIRNLEGHSKNKRKQPKRAHPRSLQKENSDQVWNELSYFKAENRSLEVQRMELQEEVDLLRVQTSQDAATIHELKVTKTSQEEEHAFQLRKLKRDAVGNRDIENQLNVFKKQLQNQTVHLERLERERSEVTIQRDDAVQEKSKLMSQLVSTQQDASTHRMELADVKHKLQMLQHQLEEKDQKLQELDQPELASVVASRLVAKDNKSNQQRSLTKKYQKTLNTSIEKMADMFNDFNEEGWEEISDENSDKESECPSSLGDSIVKQAQNIRDRKKKPAKSGAVDWRKRKPRRVPTSKPSASQPCKQTTSTKQQTLMTPNIKSCDTHNPVELREFATSPINFLSPTKSPSSASPLRKTTTRRPVAEVRQIATLKNRLHHLQQQVTLLKRVKVKAMESEAELKMTVERLQSELSSTSARLRSSRQQIAKLQDDLEELHKEREENGTPDGPMSSKSQDKKWVDCQEIKVLEAKLKVSNSEASRHSQALRTLKTENKGLHDQIRTLQDRNNHLERDVSQKRNLLESQRIKLKHAQDMNKNDASSLEEVETKSKLLSDTNNKLKVQLDSIKKRLTVISKEKKEYEEKFLKVTLELEHKTKLLQEATSRRSDLQTALTDLESSAQHQLRGLAAQSEAAIDSAKGRLAACQARIGQFQSLVKILAAEILKRVEKAKIRQREVRTEEERRDREGDRSLRRAQDKAKDILNLSTSDLEDIMSHDGDSVDSMVCDDKRSDRRWLRKCEKLVTNKDDFVHPVTSMLLQKIDERVELIVTST